MKTAIARCQCDALIDTQHSAPGKCPHEGALRLYKEGHKSLLVCMDCARGLLDMKLGWSVSVEPTGRAARKPRR